MENILLGAVGLTWAIVELTLRVRDRVRGKGGTEGDRGTRRFSGALLMAAVVGAWVLSAVAGRHSPLRVPGLEAAGVVVLFAGVVTRVWAVATLGRSFRTTVEVDVGQAVVTSGPYRWVRHPSYTGLLLAALGLGLGFGTWPGLVLCAVLPVVGLWRRIEVEEAEMTRVLGDAYEAYKGRTKRLVPGLW
ncbi:isoprenylcysteine carboxylmethyltransferase family protein [Streptomyces sp. PTM05]|uniref:Isoprenylcysteine carboxylmethyltransferase family protein n=1 Tax=Streptantibioticus parmotrematis TaxID=2873249 RepID=A0ABS7R122_9ACTN|nr:isoprenylcysteine carboxylmethyltransferase family protein [Streptantibioticus parmotrematis]MBY8889165.1 isoprenylcysteine carboxylmethyltransferase family protein [Streptantibioticus parmotrematis]